eukprot:SAG31_NODE_37129_length_307_cov_0.682692_1_plen_35_part_01
MVISVGEAAAKLDAVAGDDQAGLETLTAILQPLIT